jgi:thiopurine S-methyltransferase
MNDEFWEKKWASQSIGFHLTHVNPHLRAFWSHLSLSRAQSVFVPLCGKSVDLTWLAQRHGRVIGVELSDIAVRAFFAEQLYTPMVMPQGSHQCYVFDEIELHQGDYFSLKLSEPVDAIYDRAALIAMPPEQRQRYVAHLLNQLKPNGQILLISLERPQALTMGPPYYVPKDEIRQLFDTCRVSLLHEETEVSPKDPAHPWIESIWHIQK